MTETDQTSAPDAEPGAAGDEARDTRKPLRDDPLSVFLIAALVVLGLMYAQDEHHKRALASHAAQAKQVDLSGLAKRVGAKRCVWGATGVAHEVLLVQCPGVDATQIATALRETWTAPPAAFQRVALRDAKQTLLCAGTVASWPASCEAAPLPSKKTFQEARRRRRKRT